jgi:hypothetical protein
MTEPIRPVTPVRTLPNVLRQSLGIPPDTARMLLGTVVSAPDNVHVVVNIGGSNVTVPRLTSYVAPIPGEPCAIITGAGYTVAVGSVRAAAASAGTKFTPSATPPVSPTDGDYWLYPAAAGVTWMLRYNAGSASAYKWEYVGGPPLYAFLTADATIAAGSWNDLDGPRITVARGGDYDLEGGCTFYAHVGGGSGGRISFGLGVAAVGVTPTVWQRIAISTGTTDMWTAATAADRVASIAAGTGLNLKTNIVELPTGIDGHAQMRWLRVTPARIN